MRSCGINNKVIPFQEQASINPPTLLEGKFFNSNSFL
jgi:hypothetical protein